jgi:hypothetical protein
MEQKRNLQQRDKERGKMCGKLPRERHELILLMQMNWFWSVWYLGCHHLHNVLVWCHSPVEDSNKT